MIGYAIEREERLKEKLESGVRLKAAVGEGESQTTLSLTMSEEGGQEDRRRHFPALGFIACRFQPISVRHNTSDSCELLQEKLADQASFLFGADQSCVEWSSKKGGDGGGGDGGGGVLCIR